MPAEGLNDKHLDYMANIVLVLSRKIEGAQIWRCSDEDDEHLLLLVDHRIGFGRHVWCLLDMAPMANGNDLSIKLSRLIPRHLDIWDWSLLRHVGFPLVFINDLLKAGGQRAEENPGHAHKLVGALVIGISIVVAAVAFFYDGWLLALECGGTVFLLGAFLENLLTAKKPMADVERRSVDLTMFVNLALHEATREMPRN